MSNWTPMPPKYGPPIPQGLDSFIPFKGYWPWAQPAVKTIPSGYNLQVILVNPDPAATVWQMTIFDNKYTQTLAVQNLKVTDPALFNVPSNWAMPLKISIAVFKDTVPNVSTTVTQVLGVQSYQTTNPFTGQPDPTYKAVFVSTLGNLTFNCATLNFQ